MNCPFCEREMEFGYIQNRDGVYWMRSKRAISTIMPPKHDREVVSLNDGKVSYFAGGSAEAWLCRKCKKVVVDYAPKPVPDEDE